MIPFLTIAILVTAFIYAGLILWFFVGWLGSHGKEHLKPVATNGSFNMMAEKTHKRTATMYASRDVLAAETEAEPTSHHTDETDGLFFSVVVAARDESIRIAGLFDALAKQSWHPDRFEVVVVDDHSSDDTLALAEAYAKRLHQPCFRVISSRDRGCLPGKKHALDLGVRDARGTYIVTTDADCQPGVGWLGAVASCIAATKADMILGPVQIDGAISPFAKMQELEFMSLMGVTGGSTSVGRPVMANGANLAFRKKLFVALEGYTGNMQYASGDDVFLLHKFKRRPDCRMVFLKDRAAVVQTAASNSLGAFFRQRGRWAGKAVGYKDWFTLLVGGVVALFNMMLMASLIVLPVIMWQPAGGASGLWSVSVTSCLLGSHPVSDGMLLVVGLCSAWLVKCLADLLILIPVTAFFKRSKLLWYFLPVFLVYPLYVAVSLTRGLRT